MKHIFQFLNFANLKEQIQIIISRFPLAILLIFIVSWLFWVILHSDLSNLVEDNIIKTILSLIITFFLSIGIAISCENNKISGIKKIFAQFIAIIFWIFFFLSFTPSLDSFENIIFFLLSLTGVISYFFFAPYIKKIFSKNVKQSVYYTYFYKISSIFLISSILWVVLFILWNIAIAAIFELFDISGISHSKITGDWTIFALAFITPIFALTQIPNQSTYNENHFNENIFFSFLIKYIAIPFIYVYFFILYAYSIKVLSNFWDWPKGEVSWMVIGFSIFWYITYLFSYIFENNNKFIRYFRKGFPFVVIPQLFMLAYAIYLRVAQYDITINRYFVIVFGIWLSIISLYYIFSKKKSLYMMISTLGFFVIMVSIGPWSVYNLPENRQYNRLIHNLSQANILQNGTITPLKNSKDITIDLSKDIYSWIEYLCDFDNCNKIKQLFSKEYKALLKKDSLEFENRMQEKQNEKNSKSTTDQKYEEPRTWEIVRYITEYIKVENNMYNNNNISSIYLYWKENIFPIEMQGYSKIYTIDNHKSSSSKNIVYMNEQKNTLEFLDINWNLVNTLDMTSIIEKLSQKYMETQSDTLDIQDMTFIVWEYKIILSHISMKNPEYTGTDSYKYSYANGYVLVK